jgi:hypothetical protein
MTRLQEAAVHEAGHAVVAIALGLRVEVVHVRRAVACDGACVVDPRGPDASPAVLVAGDVAVELARAGWPAPNASPGSWYWQQLQAGPTDRERTTAATAPTPALGTSDAEKLAAAGLSARNARARAGEILGAHWPAVRAIADALIARGELEGAEVHRIAAARGVAPTKRKAPPAAGPRRRAPRVETSPAGWYRVVS